ncbi:MAG: virulence factor [Alphaproteobacteria bacterium]|nr:virulence factor [Alphaproteobacteria bacterium]
MAELTVIYWRDIPAQVIVRSGRRTAKRELAPRFQEAIDRAAMVGGARETDAYLAEWRRAAPEPCGDDLERAAQEAADRLEAAYDAARLAALAKAGGRDVA